MSKKLEALKEIKASHLQAHIDSKNIGNFDIWFDEYYETIKQALTPPTADEVCEAIQKELDYGTVEYVEGNREFMFVNHGEKQNITDCYGDRYKITGFYKSSTLSLIGWFYEELEELK